MLLAPPVGFGYYVATDDTPAAVYGASITGGTANVKGVWASVLATITYDIYLVKVEFGDCSTAVTSQQGFVDLGIGPDASNVTPIAVDLVAGSAGPISTDLIRRTYYAPLFIPAGTQLWARCQGNLASEVISVNVSAWGGPDRPGSYPVVFAWEPEGENETTTLGVAITPGASGAQGAFTQIVAASAFDYCGVMMSHCCADTTMGQMNLNGAVGIGAATEDNLGTTYTAQHASSEVIGSLSLPAFHPIPVGTRLAARMSASAAVDATHSVVLHGMRSSS